MTDSGKAVFLSYASQDAEAAERICGTLRAAGVEVWFDQSELRGGDAWDAKIRRQIKECALFVPIISVNTQARAEGYFRLEWRLADQRTQLMGRSKAFLLPVSVDDTRDAKADVPDSFLAVQWTRLPGGETPPAFAERVKALLAGRRVAGAAGPGPASARPATTKRARAWPWLAIAGFGAAAVGSVLIWQPWPRPENPAVRLAAPVSDARQLIQQALTLLEDVNVVRADLETAEQFFEKAKALDPTDGEVWAVGAMIDTGYVDAYYDTSDARKGEARTKAARALKFAPHSFEARLAQAMVLNTVVAEPSVRPEAERLVKSLLDEKPDDRWALIQKGKLLSLEGRNDEAVVYYRRANDPVAEGGTYLVLGRLTDAETAADRAISSGFSVAGLLLKANIEVQLREDLEAAQAAIDRLPASEMLEDRGAMLAAMIRFYRREPDKVLAIMRALPQDWLWWGDAPWPKAEWTAWAHLGANRPVAAQTDWRAGLRLVEERLASRSNDPPLLHQKAWFLAFLGERDGAERNLRLYQQLRGQHENEIAADTALTYVYMSSGRRDEIVNSLAAELETNRSLHADLRYGPWWDPLRGDPRFEKLLRETLPKGAKPFDDQKPAASPAAEQKSVAVLAFTNLSSDKENEYFSDGISEELLNVLAKIPGLRVVARTSAFSFKGKNVPISEITQKLNVAYVVEGSVRKTGDRVRITAQLIRAADGFHAWSESYDRKLEDIFAVQDEIAQTIVRALRPALVAGSDPAAGEAAIKAEVEAATKGGTRNVEAYRLFLQGRYFANQFTKESLERAVDFHRQAVELDPSFTLAWAGLSRAYVGIGTYYVSDLSLNQLFERARAAAQRALALEPDLAEGHAALMSVQALYDFDWLGAEESSRKALALAPANATVVTDSVIPAIARGQAERAIALGRLSVELDPVNAEARMWLLWTYLLAGRNQEAEAAARRLIELSPTATWSYGGLGLACLLQGRLDDALAAAEREKQDWSRLTAVALVRWKQGQGAESDAALGQLIARFSTVSAYQVAWVYAYRGEADPAFAWLERAYTQHDTGLSILKLDPFLRNLHSDPRWPAFLKKMRLDD